jgi:hypothetical protein
MDFEKMLEKENRFDMVARCRLEVAEEWDKIIPQIPFLSFPSHWKVKIIPPITMAVARFWIRTDKMPKDERVSVYLDWHDRLGFVGEPYWEVYPVENDTHRCLLNETDELIETIAKALKALEK